MATKTNLERTTAYDTSNRESNEDSNMSIEYHCGGMSKLVRSYFDKFTGEKIREENIFPWQKEYNIEIAKLDKIIKSGHEEEQVKQRV